MNIADVLSVLENACHEGLKISIVDVLGVVFKDLSVLPPYDISQIEPQCLLKVVTTFRSTDGVSCPVASVHLGQSTELLHGKTILRPEIPLISN